MSAPSDADIIAAELPTVTLADGTTVTLAASMANVRLVESRFGSLTGMYEALDSLNPGEDESAEDVARRKVMGTVLDLLSCFMPKGKYRDPDELSEVLPASGLGEYTEAIGQAINVAFPQPKTPEVPAQDGPGNGQAPDPQLDEAQIATATALWQPEQPTTSPPALSPGRPSGTERPSSSGALTPSSGG